MSITDFDKFRLGETRPEEVEQALADGRAELWNTGTSSAVVQLRAFGEILFAAGNSQELLPMLDKFETHAKVNGCGAVVLGGRRGWARKLKSRGYRQVTILIKDID